MVAVPFYHYRKKMQRPSKAGYPTDPKSLGEHIRKARMDRGLLQKDVAELFGVSEDTITYWENERSYPQVHFYPHIISFLGYYPFDHETESAAGKIRKVRYRNGWTYRQCAKAMGVDAATVQAWEQSKRLAQNTASKEILLQFFITNQNALF